MLVGDKKGMQVPSESSLGESYPPGSEQESSQQQRPVANNKSSLAEQTPNRGFPPVRQRESRRSAKLSSWSKSLVFATQTPFRQQAPYLRFEGNVLLQGETTGDSTSPASSGVCGTPVQGILREEGVRSEWFQAGGCPRLPNTSQQP